MQLCKTALHCQQAVLMLLVGVLAMHDLPNAASPPDGTCRPTATALCWMMTS